MNPGIEPRDNMIHIWETYFQIFCFKVRDKITDLKGQDVYLANNRNGKHAKYSTSRIYLNNAKRIRKLIHSET